MDSANVPETAVNGTPATAPTFLHIPRAGLRKKRGMFWPNLLIISLVLTVGAFAAFHYTRHGERITVWFNDVHGLRVGSPLEEGGDQIGEVVEIGRPDDLSRRKVVIELANDKTVADLIRRNGNTFYVSRFASDRLQLKGVTKVLRGPSVVVRLGNPGAPFTNVFEGKDGMPPDPRLKWNSVRATVSFPNVFGLQAGAFVTDRGVEVGVVEKVSSEEGSDYIKVTLAFFESDEKKCLHVREHTRFFINKAKLTTKGVEGDASTVLYGAYVVAVPDPLDGETTKLTKAFDGESEAPPEHLPRIGEQQVVLESRGWLLPDTPVFYRGELAGYVHSVRRSSDSNSLYIAVRVFPWAQAQVCEKTEFFMQSKLKAQLFKSKGIFSWEGPKFEIPDPQLLLRPAIEFRTPPASGKKFGFDSPRQPSYTLHPEPKEEWLNWNSSIPIQEGNNKPAVPEPKVEQPRPVSAKFHWREAWKALVSWRKHEGMVLPIPGGVIGPANLLEPDVAEKNIRKVTFEIAGKGRDRGTPQYVKIGDDLRFMKMELEGTVARFPKERLGSIGAPADLWVVTDPDNPRALASAKLTLSGSRLNASGDSGFQAGWHGAPVVCRDRSSPAFGKVIGIFIVGDKARSAYVALFPAGITSML